MKKLLPAFFFFLLFSKIVLAATDMTSSAVPYNPTLVSIYPYVGYPISLANDQNYMGRLTENIVFNGRTYSLYDRFGNFYLNNQLVGPSITKSTRDGMLYINDRRITQFDYSNQNKDLEKDAANSLFLQAYTKFILHDYNGAFDDCKKVLAIDPNHKKTIVLATILDGIITGKIKQKDIKNVSENSLERIIKMSDDLK